METSNKSGCGCGGSLVTHASSFSNQQSPKVTLENVIEKISSDEEFVQHFALNFTNPTDKDYDIFKSRILLDHSMATGTSYDINALRIINGKTSKPGIKLAMIPSQDSIAIIPYQGIYGLILDTKPNPFNNGHHAFSLKSCVVRLIEQACSGGCGFSMFLVCATGPEGIAQLAVGAAGACLIKGDSAGCLDITSTGPIPQSMLLIKDVQFFVITQTYFHET